MVGLGDFFKPRKSNGSGERVVGTVATTPPPPPPPPSNNNAASRLNESVSSVKGDDYLSLQQKLTRSKKTLVKANSKVEKDIIPSGSKSFTSSTPPIAEKGSSFQLPQVNLEEEEEEAAPPPFPKRPKNHQPVTVIINSESDDKEPVEIENSTSIKAKGKNHENAPSSSPLKSPIKKGVYLEYLQRKAAGPIAPGSKEIPIGSPNCLLGLTFVFTGELDSLSREDAQDLVKRYGGRTTLAPSGRTSYVVVGREAGKSKLEKIEKLGIKKLSEDELLDLIRHSNNTKSQSNPSESTFSLKSKDEYITKPTSIPQEDIIKADFIKHSTPAKLPHVTIVHPEISKYELWTDKYAPQTEKELIGNHSVYEKIVQWLQTWNPQVEEKAVLISGPPGIGKTTAARMACRQAGMEMVEMNASDTRSKSALHDHISDMIDNRSLAGFSNYFSKKSGGKGGHGKFKKQALIMDEVDGMSAGDRGGMAELIQIIKKTKIPIICICNDRGSPKVRSLTSHCLDLRFRRPDARMITPRVLAIAEKEGLTLGVNTIEELVASTQGDIRQILNLLSTYRLTASTMDYDQSKRIGGAGKKDIDQGPFDVVPTLLGSGFDRMSLADKIDQYFVDSSLVPLMIQENYIRARANGTRTIKGKSRGHSFMDLCAAAAESISDADVVDTLIHGANQEWSLAPLHAVLSCVHPAYFCHGVMGGRVLFPSWLGQNSKQSKNLRLLREITKHTFLHTAVGQVETRLCYAPILARILLDPLEKLGVEGIDKTISLMDTYSLAKDDVDSLIEMMLDPNLGIEAYAKIPSTVKAAFTRKYNQGTHKLPYTVGGNSTLVKKISGGEFDNNNTLYGGGGEEEDGEGGGGGDSSSTVLNNEEEAGSDEDLAKDKMIKKKVLDSSNPALVASSRGRGRGRGRGKQF